MISNALPFSSIIAVMEKPARHLPAQKDPSDIHSGSTDRGEEALLWCRVLGELNALLNVALKSLDASLKELLLLLGHTVKDVDSLLGTVGLNRVCQLVILKL